MTNSAPQSPANPTVAVTSSHGGFQQPHEFQSSLIALAAMAQAEQVSSSASSTHDDLDEALEDHEDYGDCDDEHNHAGGSSASSTTGGGSRHAASSTLTYDIIQRYFDRPIAQAAKALGVSLSTLKVVNIKLGIPRWPFRRLDSLKKKVERLDRRKLEVNGAEAATIDRELQKTQKEIDKIIKNPKLVLTDRSIGEFHRYALERFSSRAASSKISKNLHDEDDEDDEDDHSEELDEDDGDEYREGSSRGAAAAASANTKRRSKRVAATRKPRSSSTSPAPSLKVESTSSREHSASPRDIVRAAVPGQATNATTVPLTVPHAHATMSIPTMHPYMYHQQAAMYPMHMQNPYGMIQPIQFAPQFATYGPSPITMGPAGPVGAAPGSAAQLPPQMHPHAQFIPQMNMNGQSSLPGMKDFMQVQQGQMMHPGVGMPMHGQQQAISIMTSPPPPPPPVSASGAPTGVQIPVQQPVHMFQPGVMPIPYGQQMTYASYHQAGISKPNLMVVKREQGRQ